MLMYFDPLYLVVMLPALLIALWAQWRVRSAFARGSQLMLRSGLRGIEVARAVLDANGLYDVPVEHIPGELTDHYDPRQRVLRLSTPVYGGTSAAAAGVAAHEAGHALQHARGYVPIRLRNAILPVAALGGNLALPMFFFGLLFTGRGAVGMSWLMTAGILLFSGFVAFHIVTLPVEVNASRRALTALTEAGVFRSEEEIESARSVLTAAALTYVAGALQAVLTLLYMIARSRRR